MNYKNLSKTIIFTFLVLIISTSMITTIAIASDNTEGELEYTLSDNWNYYIVSGLGTFNGKDVIIPEKYNDLPVEEIAENAFSNCSEIETLYVPGTVNRIGKYAFSNCSNLKSAKIMCYDMGYNTSSSHYETTQKCYGYSIFSGCSSLESLYIRDIEFEAYLSSVYNYTNYYPIGYIFGTSYYSGSTACSQPYYRADRADLGYTYFYFPQSLKIITLGGFGLEAYTGGAYTNPLGGRIPVEKIIIDDGIKVISRDLFKGLKGLDTLILPSSITEIGNEAFYNTDILNINYLGTPSQWDEITVGNYNDALTDKINFIKFTKTTISEDGKEFVINPTNIETGKAIILVLYENKKLVEMRTAIYEGTEISFTTACPYDEAKVMVLSNLSTLNPVSYAEIIK